MLALSWRAVGLVTLKHNSTYGAVTLRTLGNSKASPEARCNPFDSQKQLVKYGLQFGIKISW